MINFQKYHGCGNDFIMINNLDKSISLLPEQIKLYCDRNFGIGADGIILLEPSDKADCFMNYYNSDGTIAQMCGNGARCTAKFYIEQTKSDLKDINLDTRAGVKNIKINEDNTFSVDMGMPVFTHKDFPAETLNLLGYNFDSVSMGNPHTVAMVADLDKIEIKEIGPKIETDINFPNKTNVEFVEKKSDNFYKVKVWERGCGATLACGTGACAVYSIIKKKYKNISTEYLFEELTLEFPGGNLFLSENREGHIILRGPAVFVFKGEI